LARTKHKSPAASNPGTGQRRPIAKNGGVASEQIGFSDLLSGSGQRYFINSNLNPIPQGEGNG
jgi:hypothetical protein